MEKLKYPIGRFSPQPLNDIVLAKSLEDIEHFPSRIRNTVNPLNQEKLGTPYRPGGWTIKQLVHHCADSHMNAFIRFKLALTEDVPTIKPYDEAAWANLADYQLPVTLPLALLDLLHEKWMTLLKAMTLSDFNREYYHPEAKKKSPLSEIVQMYAWHCNHHLAHITEKIKREGW
jgi:hypothetical protein